MPAAAPILYETTGATATESSPYAQDATSVVCDIPSNTPGDFLVAFVCGYQGIYASPEIDISMSGWTPIASIGLVSGLFNTEVHTEAFYHAGGIYGQATATLNKGVSIININIHAISGSSSSLDGSNTGSASYSGYHPINGITTTKANDLLLECWGFNLFGQELASLQYTTEIQAVAGATGTKSISTYPLNNKDSANIMVALSPFTGPTIPNLTWPSGGESLTAGAGVTITWEASSSPTADPSTLKYNIDYSSNYGASWTQIVFLTAAGATSYSWTVPSGLGNGYQIRIRANDPAIGVYSQGYDYSGYFSVVSETAPGPPIITAPPAGSVQNKSANVTVSWIHQGGVGNPQTEFTLQWDDNAEFSSPTTVGPTATGVQSTLIDFSALANGTTVYVKVKTKGLSLYSVYSNVRSFIVAVAPATPNITAPTAGSPPTIPLPTITFTESDPFVSRKFRVVKAGLEVYNSGEVFSTALSFTSPYTFANGVTVTIYLSVKNSWGLWSAEDSETVTPSYVGPRLPLIAVTPDSSNGRIFARITNNSSLLTNLVAFWNLNESSGSRADSIGTNTLSDNGSVGSGAGKVKNAAVFSGSNYLNKSSIAATNLSMGDVDFTIAAWFKFTGSGGQMIMGVLSPYGDYASQYVLDILTAPPRVRFYTERPPSTYISIESNITLQAGTWYLAIAWHDSVNNLIGLSVSQETPVTTNFSGGTSTADRSFGIGATGYGGSPLTGSVDAAAVWRGRVLTATERAALWNNGNGVELDDGSSPDYNELWRYEAENDISTAIKVGVNLPLDVNFADYNVISGVDYRYIARAYVSSTGLYTDAESSNVSIILTHPFLHSVARTSTTNNSAGIASLTATSSEWKREEAATLVKLLGRDKPALVLGQPQWQRLTVSAAFASYADVEALLAIWRTQKIGATLCYRDEKGNRIFGKVSNPTADDQLESVVVQFEIVEGFYVEGL